MYDGESSSEIPVLNIETSVNKINSVLGVNLSNERVDGILKRLDFSVDINSNGDMSVKYLAIVQLKILKSKQILSRRLEGLLVTIILIPLLHTV